MLAREVLEEGADVLGDRGGEECQVIHHQGGVRLLIVKKMAGEMVH